jgi:hypothetical protein
MEFVRSNWSTKCINLVPMSIHFLHKDIIILFRNDNSFYTFFGTWELLGTGSSLFGREPHQTCWHNGSINLRKQLTQNMPCNNLSGCFPNSAVMLCNQSNREVILTEVLLKRWPYWIIWFQGEHTSGASSHQPLPIIEQSFAIPLQARHNWPTSRITRFSAVTQMHKPMRPQHVQ